jgi:hypothetical protein
LAPDNDTIIASYGQALPGREVSLVINLSSLVRERAEIRAYSELQAVMKEA